MEVNNNPLRQFFRRPSIYLRLPSGGAFYNSADVTIPENGEIPVYPMTAIDDITVKTPDALFNGQAVVDVIKSCVPCIKDPWKLNSIDIDAVLIAIRSASSVEGIEIVTGCPACSEESTYTVNLAGTLSTLKSPDYQSPLLISGLKLFFRPLVYRELNQVNLMQFEMQKTFANLDSMQDQDERTKQSSLALKRITDLTMETLGQAIKSIAVPDGPEVTDHQHIVEYLRSCDKADFELVKGHIAKLKEASSLKISMISRLCFSPNVLSFIS